MNSLSNIDDHSQDRDKEPVIPSFLLGGPRWPNCTASSAQEQMPTAGERIAALEAEVAALRDAVAALRLEAVPGALAALAAGQADMAAALRDAAAASHAEERPEIPDEFGARPLRMAPAAHAAALALQSGPSVGAGTDLRDSWPAAWALRALRPHSVWRTAPVAELDGM